jgi:hypothetical protein
MKRKRVPFGQACRETPSDSQDEIGLVKLTSVTGGRSVVSGEMPFNQPIQFTSIPIGAEGRKL